MPSMEPDKYRPLSTAWRVNITLPPTNSCCTEPSAPMRQTAPLRPLFDIGREHRACSTDGSQR